MARLFWDASGLIKRYFPEVGKETVNALFAASASHEMLSTPWGYAEAYSLLLRRFNGGVLNLASFTTAVTALQQEVVDDGTFRMLSVSDSVIFASPYRMRQHNLNATDAALLTTLLDHAAATPMHGPLVVVAADQRLLRAAAAEGLVPLNPETLPAADVLAFLAAL